MKEFIKKLLRENLLEIRRHLGHKIPVGDIFFHDNINKNGYNVELNRIIDVYHDDKSFEENPIETVDVRKIVPTQRFVDKDNLDDIKKVGNNTGAYLVEYKGLYYLLDGHHRVAHQIMIGEPTVRAFVQRVS